MKIIIIVIKITKIIIIIINNNNSNNNNNNNNYTLQNYALKKLKLRVKKAKLRSKSQNYAEHSAKFSRFWTANYTLYSVLRFSNKMFCI